MINQFDKHSILKVVLQDLTLIGVQCKHSFTEAWANLLDPLGFLDYDPFSDREVPRVAKTHNQQVNTYTTKICRPGIATSVG